jgi:hypothetical protein
MRIYSYRESHASQITSRFALIGHAGRAAAALPAIAALIYYIL